MRTGLLVAGLLLGTALCGTAQVVRNQPQIARVMPVASTWSISGVVVSATTGTPLDRAEVSISGVGSGSGQLAEMITGETGAFRFDGVPTGKYLLQASRRGYVAANYQEHEGGYSTAIVTGPGIDSQGVRFGLMPAAVVTGTVTDDAGEPVRSAQVTLYRRDQLNGESKVVTAGSDQTDDTGYYEFARLRAGTYFVAVTATPWYAMHPVPRSGRGGQFLAEEEQPRSPLDVAYPITFYANATDSGSATPLRVRAGDHMEANVSLHAVPAVHVRLEVPEGTPGGMVAPPQVEEDVFGNEQSVGASQRTTTTTSDGKQTTLVELTGVAPGHYTLRRVWPGGGAVQSAAVDLTADQKLEFSGSSEATSVSGKLVMASGVKLPEGMFVTLHPATGAAWVPPARVDPDGSFAFATVPAGSYDIQVTAPGKSLAIAQIAASGAEAQGSHITVGDAPALVAASLVSGSATITGFAQRHGRGAGGAMIVLVPRDPQARELYRRDQSDSDGSFSLLQVAPGEYTVVAIGEGWNLEWARPGVLAPYLMRGTKVRVVEDDRTVALPGAVEVQ